MYAFLDKTEQILNKLSKFVPIIENHRMALSLLKTIEW